MPTVEKFSPCKVNLMLAILGPRPDGFHELLSLVAPTKFGDTLIAERKDLRLARMQYGRRPDRLVKPRDKSRRAF